MADLSFQSMLPQHQEAVNEIRVTRDQTGDLHVHIPESIVEIRELFLTGNVSIPIEVQNAYFHNKDHFGTTAAKHVSTMTIATINCARHYEQTGEEGMIGFLRVLHNATEKLLVEITGA
jgi:hypothetical protein